MIKRKLKIINSELPNLSLSNANYIEENKEKIKFIIIMIIDSNYYQKFLNHIEQITRSNTSYNNLTSNLQIDKSSSDYLIISGNQGISDRRIVEESVKEYSNILDKNYYDDYIGEDTLSILKKSEISFYVGHSNKETNEKCYYGKIIFDGGGLIYKKYKMIFDKGENQTFGNEFVNRLFSNYVKSIKYLENLKNNMINKIKQKNLNNLKLLIKYKIKTIDENETPFRNMSCEYTLVNPILIEINNNKYKDYNILNNEKYEGFELFIKHIIMIIYGIELNNKENEKTTLPEFGISSISLNSYNIYTTSTRTNLNLIQYLQYKLLGFINILANHNGYAEYIKELSDGTFISGGKDERVVFYKNFKKNGEIKKNSLGVFDIKGDNQVVIFSENNLYMRPYDTTSNETEMKFKENLINIIILYAKTTIACTEKGIYILTDLVNKIVQSHKDIIYQKKYIGAIKVNDKLAIFNSNSILVNGEDKIISYNINNKKIIDCCSGYSFTISRNNMSIMNIPNIYDNLENNKLLFVACKKYTNRQKNGILLMILEIKNSNIIKIYKKFYYNRNYEVYCFCPIFTIKNKYILDDRNKDIIREETKYFLVGGFDLNKREGLIKLYRVIFNKDYKMIKIDFIVDVDIDKYIRENGNKILMKISQII